MRLALFLILIVLMLQTVEGMEYKEIINASQILTNISNGLPVEYDHVIIKGNLDLNNLKGLPITHVHRTKFEKRHLGALENVRRIASPILITDSIIDGKVNFNNTLFENLTDFADSRFSNPIGLNESIFNESSNFVGSIFDSSADFTGSTFNCDCDIDFTDSKFNGSAYFSNSNFNGTVYFWRSKFKEDANFGFSNFDGDAHFRSSNFDGVTDFRSSNFNGDADFGSSNFSRDTDFEDSNFSRDTNFKDSKFERVAKFIGCTFNRFAHFSRSKFNNVVDFSYSKFKNSTLFDDIVFANETTFSDSKFTGDTSFKRSQFKEDALFEDTFFNNSLDLTRTKYDKLYITWSNIRTFVYNEAAYQLLIGNFRKLGLDKDADNCYYQFRADQFQHWQSPQRFQEDLISSAQDSLAYFFDGVAWISYGYGKKPLYPALWSLFFIAVFGVFWHYAGLGIKDWPPATNPKRGNLWLRALKLSITIFLSGTKVFINPPDIPVLQGRSEALLRGAFIFERALGAFFSLLFFLAIGTTVVRQ